MTSPSLIRLSLTGAAAAAMAFGLAATPAGAQAVKGPGSLTGIWTNANLSGPSADSRSLALRTVEGKAAPLQPWAAKVLAKRLQDAKPGRPFAPAMAQCMPPGAPAMFFYPSPIQILESAAQVTVLNGAPSYFRIIRLNQPHREDPDATFKGDSVGHWDGDTLVVDTIAFNDGTSLDPAGTPHSDQLHLVERYRRTGKDALEVTFILSDPKAFTKPWAARARLKPATGEITENECDDRVQALANYRRPQGAPPAARK